MALTTEGQLMYPENGDAVEIIYADMLAGLSPTQAKRMHKTYNKGLDDVTLSIEEQLRKIHSGERLHSWDLDTAAAFEQIKIDYPVYANMPFEDIIKVLHRRPGTPLTDYRPVVEKPAAISQPRIQTPKPEKPITKEKTPRNAQAIRVLLALLERDEDGISPRFKYDKDVITHIYPNSLAGLTGKRLAAKMHTLNQTLKLMRNNFTRGLLQIQASEHATTPAISAQIALTEIRKDPRYESMSIDEIIALLPRPAPPRSMKERVQRSKIGRPVRIRAERLALVPTPKPKIEIPVPAAKPLATENIRELSELEKYEIAFGFGNKRKEIILALLQTNADGTDFLYPTTMDVAKAVYTDKVITTRGVTSEKRLANLDRTVFLSRVDFITRLYALMLNPEQKDEAVEEILAQIHSMPQHATLSPGRLMRILRRQIKFSEIQNPDPKYDEIEDVSGIPVTSRITITAPVAPIRDLEDTRIVAQSEASEAIEPEVSTDGKNTSHPSRALNAAEQTLYHTPFSEEHTYIIGLKIIALNQLTKPDLAKSLGVKIDAEKLQTLLNLKSEYEEATQGGIVYRARRVKVPAERSIDHLLTNMYWQITMTGIDPDLDILAKYGLPAQPLTWRGQVLGIVGRMKDYQLRAFKKALNETD